MNLKNDCDVSDVAQRVEQLKSTMWESFLAARDTFHPNLGTSTDLGLLTSHGFFTAIEELAMLESGWTKNAQGEWNHPPQVVRTVL